MRALVKPDNKKSVYRLVVSVSCLPDCGDGWDCSEPGSERRSVVESLANVARWQLAGGGRVKEDDTNCCCACCVKRNRGSREAQEERRQWRQLGQ
jgi:hypothetical protein